MGRQLTVAAALAAGTLLLGALTRLVADPVQGPACRGWPLCYGQLVPVFDEAILVAWLHRVASLALGLVVAWAAAKGLRQAGVRRILWSQLIAAVGLLVAEAALGALTASRPLSVPAATAHFAEGLLLLTVLVSAAARAHVHGQPTAGPGWPRTGTGGNDQHSIVSKSLPLAARLGLPVLTALAVLQTALGAAVSLAGADVPSPQLADAGAALLAAAHRGLTGTTLILAIALALVCVRHPLPPTPRLAIRLAPTLMLLQFLLGMVNTYSGGSVWSSLGHLAVALTLVALLLIGAVVALDRPGRPRDQGVSPALTLPLRGDWRIKDLPR